MKFFHDDWLVRSPAEADLIIFPVPYEGTTSYQRGTRNGPAAIAEASYQVELYLPDAGVDLTERMKVSVASPFEATGSHEGALAKLSERAADLYRLGKPVIALGGEHSITPALFRALKEHPVCRDGRPVSVVQIDAHSDLREEYEGSRLNHACAMYPIAIDQRAKLLPLGIRNYSRSEAEVMKKHKIVPIPPPEFKRERFLGWIDTLDPHVYLTIDVDGFDPSVIPSTGTPEPGGLFWYDVLEFISQLFARRRVIAMDIVELMPIETLKHSDFAVAKLVYYCIGQYHHCRKSL